ncbi:hypothetical protein [Pedobacter panaciterrae]
MFRLTVLLFIFSTVEAQTISYSADGANYKDIKDSEIKNKTISIPKANGMTIKINGPDAYNLKIDDVAAIENKPHASKEKSGTALWTIVSGSFTTDGNYTAGTAMTDDNNVKMKVVFKSTGFYTITSDVVNGIQFFTTGFVEKAGQRDVILKSLGTPIDAGNFTFKIGTSVNIGPIPFDGSKQTVSTITNITTPASKGMYVQGITLDESNTIKVSITSTAPGIYDINTKVVNGVFFRGTGKIAASGTSEVLLKGYGTPVSEGTGKFTLGANGGTTAEHSIPFADSPNDSYTYEIPNEAKKVELSDPVGGDTYTIELTGDPDVGDQHKIALANTSYLNYVQENYGATNKTFKVTPYGLLINSKLNGKDYLYGGQTMFIFS